MTYIDIFEKFYSHRIQSVKNEDCPYYDESAIVLREELWTMDDGTELKYCRWTSGKLCICDITVDKEKFGKNIGYDFSAYLNKNGLPTENNEELLGDWECGEISSEEESMVQFTTVMKNVNEKFDNAFDIYCTTMNAEERSEAFELMVKMFNSFEITPDQYQVKYDILFPEMTDPTFIEPVDPDGFLGFHVEPDD